MRVLLEQVVGGEDHAGGADPALGSAVLEEALLDRVQRSGGFGGETFNGGDRRAVSLQDRHQAGVDELAIHQHGAGAALAFAAPFLGSGEAEVFAQHVEQALHGRRVDGLGSVVDCEVNFSHWLAFIEKFRPSVLPVINARARINFNAEA